MPRKYIRKCPDRKVCTQEQIDKAKQLIGEGKSKRAAAEIVGINESTLRKRLKLNSTATSMGRYQQTFTREQEEEIYNHCKSSDERFYGLTLNTLRKLVYEFAEVNEIENRFDKTTKMAGKDWVYEFIKRHPDLALKQTTPTSIARAIGFNQVQVNRFYTNLKKCQEKYNFPPGRIYNMDETGISTVPKKTPKVISLKGKKNVNKIVSGERGQTITAVCCVSATGNYVPPPFIFPRKRMKGELMDGAPTGSIGMTSDSGFINTDLYLEWLHHFKDYTSPTVDNPVLLIIDNHSSHISLQGTLYCRQHNIIVLTLPPHSSHKLQPLDRAIYSPLKSQYAIKADKWMAQHPGRSINQYQVTLIFNRAFLKIATVGNAASAFRVTGIYPFNNDLFTEADFAPSSVTDMFCPTSDTVLQNPSTSSSLGLDHHIVSVAPVPQELVASASADLSETQFEISDVSTVAEVHHPSSSPLPRKPNIETDIQKANEPSHALSDPMDQIEEFQEQQIIPPPVLGNISNTHKSHIPLINISPLPKATHIQIRRKNASKSEIITNSPFKNMLEEKQKEVDRKSKKIRKPKMNMETKTKPKKKDNIKTNTKTKDNDKNKCSEQEYYCPLCQEKYGDTAEAWIKCSICSSWWHEACTSCESGIFTCDLCVVKD
ncbi:uncharacterized protein LOC105842267 [Bombyx mori]|uniref:DDE-1 domain-containing protein n=1 Tax=Bombyx mori TaxID=7091 RepID=A0A8R2GAN0_BOMMO|nr:uncharacterized protein LOC105842267 [Bombyx mori]